MNVYKIGFGDVSFYVVARSVENAERTFRREYRFTPSGRNIIIPEHIAVEQVDLTDEVVGMTAIIELETIVTRSGYSLNV